MHLRRPLTFTIALLLSHGVTAASAKPNEGRRIEGSWRIVEMSEAGKRVPIPEGLTLIMRFDAARHRWALVATKGDQVITEQGSFKLRGDRLTTRTDDKRKVENIRVDFRGTHLKFFKENGTLLLERISDG